MTVSIICPEPRKIRISVSIGSAVYYLRYSKRWDGIEFVTRPENAPPYEYNKGFPSWVNAYFSGEKPIFPPTNEVPRLRRREDILSYPHIMHTVSCRSCEHQSLDNVLIVKGHDILKVCNDLKSIKRV